MSSFPQTRLRRLRGSPAMRRIAQETRLSASDFIYPLFVTHGRNVQAGIEPMPDMYQLSLDRLILEIGAVVELGIPAVLLFGIPRRKDAVGSEAYEPNGIVQEAIRVIKQAAPELLVISDVCLCDYTDHGHCGVVSNGVLDNDRSLELLARVKQLDPYTPTKSGIIVGMGEKLDEVVETMKDLRSVDCNLLTVGQYLRPSEKHVPVARFYRPEEFQEIRRIGEGLGFKHVAAGPLVRSSYHADEQQEKASKLLV